ncbi:MAG: hypothetical protein ABR913_05905 [Sedimentisphaerales bacterium]|jgi:hypothetical protein
MAKQILRDKNGFIIGYLETRSDGEQTIRDSAGRMRGKYDPKRNFTYDENGRHVGEGNLLASLITSSQEINNPWGALLGGISGYLLGRMTSEKDTKQSECEEGYVQENEPDEYERMKDNESTPLHDKILFALIEGAEKGIDLSKYDECEENDETLKEITRLIQEKDTGKKGDNAAIATKNILRAPERSTLRVSHVRSKYITMAIVLFILLPFSALLLGPLFLLGAPVVILVVYLLVSAIFR